MGGGGESKGKQEEERGRRGKDDIPPQNGSKFNKNKEVRTEVRRGGWAIDALGECACTGPAGGSAALCGIPLGPLSGHPVVLRSVGHVLRGNAAYQRVSWKGSRGRVSKCQHLFRFQSRGRGGVSGVGGGGVVRAGREELSSCCSSLEQ